MQFPDLDAISRAAGVHAIPLGSEQWRLALPGEALVATGLGLHRHELVDRRGFCTTSQTARNKLVAAGELAERAESVRAGERFRLMLAAMAQLGKVGEPELDGRVPIRFGTGALAVQPDADGTYDVTVNLDGEWLIACAVEADGLRALVACMEAAYLTTGETRRAVCALVKTVVATAGRLPAVRLRELATVFDEDMAGALDLHAPADWLHADVRGMLHMHVARERASYVDQEAMACRHASCAGWLHEVDVHGAAVFYTAGVAVDMQRYVVGEVALSRPEDALVVGMLGIAELLFASLCEGTDSGLYAAAIAPVTALLRDPTFDPRAGVAEFIDAADGATELEPELCAQILFRARGVLAQWR